MCKDTNINNHENNNNSNNNDDDNSNKSEHLDTDKIDTESEEIKLNNNKSNNDEIKEMVENVKIKEKDKSIVIKKTIENIDKSLIDNLSNLLSSEVKAKIYIYLRKYGKSTVDEIAHGTGIYPSTVREVILDMYKNGIVCREKLDKEGLGKKPYIYSAVSPSELVKKLSKGLQNKLNEVIMIDKKIKKKEIKIPFLPVKIVINNDIDEAK